MNTFADSVLTALDLIRGADPQLGQIVGLSLGVSGAASLIAALIGLGLGAALALLSFRGRRLVLALLNTSLALPPVVVGLVVYLLLSRSGPLGEWGLLFTPTAMVMAQTVLILPIVVALTRQALQAPWALHGEQLQSMGASRPVAALLLLWDERLALLTVVLAAFGRAVAEVGAVMIVGGNIAGHTRVMTTAIALETSKGDLPLALALGLVLLGVVLLLNLGIAALRAWQGRGEAAVEGQAHD
ncbi:ABC transporter permease [Piscinibacter sp. Jin2]|uniref:ABC transporter permease n=1 Tax=Aquariibacter lacus TaxID=2801332 RepID=A0A9X0XF60_9BURK|nr:ABC transporter permease [Piscinibacter lacus]MBL0719876.1 ABC transporter permease [Piscinibacter lacus]